MRAGVQELPCRYTPPNHRSVRYLVLLTPILCGCTAPKVKVRPQVAVWQHQGDKIIELRAATVVLQWDIWE